MFNGDRGRFYFRVSIVRGARGDLCIWEKNTLEIMVGCEKREVVVIRDEERFWMLRGTKVPGQLK